MEKSMFFNSVDRDRLYNADDLCLYLSSLFESGVLKRDDGTLDVTAGDGMQIVVSPGYAFIDGHLYVNDESKVIDLDGADGIYDRIDSVVVRMDRSLRQITVELKKGQNASKAQVPAINRDGDLYELQICYIEVSKGIARIEQSMIVDTRSDTTVCGYVINNAEEGERLQKQIDQMKTDNPLLITSYADGLLKFWRDRAKQENAYIDGNDVMVDTGTSVAKIIDDLITGAKTVEKSNDAKCAKSGFDIGSTEAPNRMLRLFTGHDGSYYRIHAWYTGDPAKDCLWLELVDKNGNIIGTPFKIIDGEGTIDRALAVPWSGVTGKPESFPPSSHNHDDKYLTEAKAIDKLKDYITKEGSGLLVRPATAANTLTHTSDGTKNGLIEVADTYNGDTANCPYDPFMGLKIQYNVSNSISFVLLYEVSPNPGNVWLKVHNSNWRSWVCISGRKQLWTGSIGEGDQVELNAYPSYFRRLELYVDILETPITVPYNEYSESIYGGLSWKGDGDNFIQTAGQFIINEKQLTIAKLGKKNLSSGVYTSGVKLLRVVGVS